MVGAELRWQALKKDKDILLGCLALVFIVYCCQGILENYEADDINQVQGNLAWLGLGRWAGYPIFANLFRYTPLSMFSIFLASGLLVASAYGAAVYLGIKSRPAKVIFILVASITLFYQFMFSFDCTQVAFPLGNLLTVTGLLLTKNRKWFFAVPCFVLAMAMYQAVLMYGATLILLRGFWLAQEEPDREGDHIRSLGGYILIFAASLVGYVVVTGIIQSALDVTPSDRLGLSWRAILDNADVWIPLVGQNVLAWPGLGYNYYISRTVCAFGLVAYLLAVAVSFTDALSDRKWLKLAYRLAIIIGLAISPIWIIFITETDYFAHRTLYSYAAVYGAFFAFAFVRLSAMHLPFRRALLGGLVLVVASSTLLRGVRINERSYDEHLAWMYSKHWALRVIDHLDREYGAELPGFFIRTPEASVPIAVLGSISYKNVPRGDVASPIRTRWAKMAIFSLLDPRFRSAGRGFRERAAVAAEGRPAWPHPDSVFPFENGYVVIIAENY